MASFRPFFFLFFILALFYKYETLLSLLSAVEQKHCISSVQANIPLKRKENITR